MRALHLPGLSTPSSPPPYSYPTALPLPSSLIYSPDSFPDPENSNSSSGYGPILTLHVLTTALTRGELDWAETLDPQRWTTAGGAIPGHDVVGVLAQLHRTGYRNPGGSSNSDITSVGCKLELGAKVWGLIGFPDNGAAADFCLARSSELCRAPMCPEGIGEREWDEQCATIPLSGLSAWQALFERGGVEVPNVEVPRDEDRTETRVLITGAAGTVGNLAVQLAKAAGCSVVAVASGRNIDFVQTDLGADEVIDYTSAAFTNLSEEFMKRQLPPVDFVVDTAGGETLKHLLLHEGAVKNHGKVISVAYPLEAFGANVKTMIEEVLKKRGLHFEFFIVEPSGRQLEQIATLVETGKVRGYVDSVYDLPHGMEAMEKVETRGAVVRGKVVLRVS